MLPRNVLEETICLNQWVLNLDPHEIQYTCTHIKSINHETILTFTTLILFYFYSISLLIKLAVIHQIVSQLSLKSTVIIGLTYMLNRSDGIRFTLINRNEEKFISSIHSKQLSCSSRWGTAVNQRKPLTSRSLHYRARLSHQVTSHGYLNVNEPK